VSLAWLSSMFRSRGPALINRDWIATIPSWPESFTYRSMVDTAMELSKELRDPEGEHKVEIIIALTHCRVPNVSHVF
jgi:5'-nucleotidase